MTHPNHLHLRMMESNKLNRQSIKGVKEATSCVKRGLSQFLKFQKENSST